MDLIFRNETRTTERKVQRSKFHDHGFHNPLKTAAVSTDVEWSIAHRKYGAWANGANFLMPLSFMQDPEKEALCYWFLHFVMLPRHPDSICGYMEHLLPLYQNAKVDSLLSLITSASALSSLGKVHGRKSLMPVANKMYGRALIAAQSSIYDPVEAKKDETLMAVMLMSLYEVSHPRNPQSTGIRDDLRSSHQGMVCSCPNLIFLKAINMPRHGKDYHTDGAVALAKHRGEEQLQSEMSRNLLQAVRTQMVMTCIERRKPIEILPGHTEWFSNFKQQNAANRLTILTAGLPELRLNAKKTFYSVDSPDVKSVRALRDAAVRMDISIAGWVGDLPEAWSYRVITHVEAMPEHLSTADAFPGDIDLYQDVYVANTWNTYRIARFLALSIVIDSSCWLASVSESQQETDFLDALATIRRLVRGICASIPFHLCSHTSSAALELGSPHSTAACNISDNRPSTRMLGAYFLLTPLKVLLQQSSEKYPYRQWNCLPSEQKMWLEGRLAHLRSLCIRDC
ncbi:MAG: hypothetical protein M1835_001691 [Candelina submexicana]|nr:MAG: hypothetical protein M1835_001691 [Candelina submexicana]